VPAAQLESLRAFVASRPAPPPPGGGAGAATTVLVVGSGKGGSGTSVAAALLALSAAAAGRRALLVDLDEHVGPQRLLLGVAPAHGLAALRAGRAPDDLLVPVSATLSLLPGGGSDEAPLAPAERRALLRRAAACFASHDVVVVDAGSRLDAVRAGLETARAAQAAAAAAPAGGGNLAVRLLVVTGADPVALAASYALVKSVAADALADALPVDVLAGRLDDDDARRAFEHVDAAARHFLRHPLRYAGALPDDATLAVALRAGMPLQDAAAGSPAALAMQAIAARLVPPPGPPPRSAR
jgi:MinD-like ATPase involved in chromosome partitioning or flagellar assembly